MSDRHVSLVADPDVLATLTEHLDAVADEAVLEFRADGIAADMVDPANVAMVNVYVGSEALDAYDANGVSLGVDLERFEDYVTTGEGPVQLALNTETRRLEITHPETSFSMAAIDPDAMRDAPDIDDASPDEGFVVDAELDAAALAHGVNVAGMVSDHITVDADPDRDSPVHLLGEGDTDDARVEYGNSLHEGSTVDEAADSAYSREYLESLTKPMPKTAAVRLQTGDDWPMRFDYDLFEGAGTVSMLCAPRIKTR